VGEVHSAEGVRAAIPFGVDAPAPTTERPATTQSFDAFFRDEFPRLVALARAVSGSESAEDLAQEAMLVVYARWSEVSEFDQPEVWVRRVCLNLSRSLVRRRMIEVRALLRLGGRPAQVAAELEPDDQRFWAIVGALPRRQAQAIALRYIYDLEVSAIAATMGCSVGSVKVHLGRGRAALARRLDLEEVQ
jgi:RNA polymerase sigma factor (sigma-70 family)